MIWSRAILPVVAVAAAAACGGGGGGSAAHLVRTHGTIVRVGGPMPGSPLPIAGARLEIRGRGGSTQVRSDRHGRFAFDLPPGTYRVTAIGHSLLHNASLQPIPQVIHVRAHARPLRLYVDIK
jgi:Carboxypeptidase regulatory-like domain